MELNETLVQAQGKHGSNSGLGGGAWEDYDRELEDIMEGELNG